MYKRQLTACSGGADASQEAGQEQEANQETGQKQEGESPDGQENVEEGKNSEAAAGTEKANWTIEEATVSYTHLDVYKRQGQM